MASATPSSVEHLLQAVNTDGFFALKDAAKGLEADEFAKKDFPIATVDGLQFCKVHTFDDPRITGFLESTFDWSGLGMFTYLHPFPDCAHGFLARVPQNLGLIVQIWGRGSKATFYKGSQAAPLNIRAYHNELLEIPLKQLEGCEPVTVVMDEGGL
ncbi:MAG: hypothetical protein Q9173_003495 [Seirophora scorigena]